MRFDELRLAEPLLRALISEGYATPTPIQAKAIPHVLAGRDPLGCAQTGTGKTAAFALPILDRLSRSHADQPAAAHAHAGHEPHRQDHARGHGRGHAPRLARSPGRPIRALILAPTRELAAQIGDSFRAYGKNLHLRHAVIFGGVNQNPQTRALSDGVDIVVATPGRLLDLMNQGYVDLRHVEVFVLDEADRMLDMGFIHDIRKIAAKLPATPHPQTLLFSATMPGEIRSLSATLLRNPVSVEVAAVSATADRIDQAVYFVDKKNKSLLMIHLLKNTSYTRVLAFTRTKHGADKVVRQLYRDGIPAEAIHSNKSQNARIRALENFRTGKTPVLIASDIAARGIDIDEISHVINYDLPNVPETYVHRIGRTARAGASGVAISFCSPDERPFLRDIERLTRVPVAVREDQPAYPASSHADDHASERPSGGPRPPRSHHAAARAGHGSSGHNAGHTPRSTSGPNPRQGQGAGHRGGQGGGPASSGRAARPGGKRRGRRW